MKLKFVRKTLLPEELGRQIKHKSGLFGEKILHRFLLNKGLIIVQTIKLIKHKIDKPQGFVSNNVGIFISILFSLIVQLDNVILL